MTPRIDIIRFGTFGNPYGYTQTVLNISKDKSNISVKALDINTNAIKLFPNTEMYSIRKDLVSNSKSIAFTKYVYVKEKNSTRGGTFIGSSLLLTNFYSNELNTLNILNEICTDLVINNTENNIIISDHSDKMISKINNFNYDGLRIQSNSISKLTDWKINQKFLVYYCLISDLSDLAETMNYSLELLNFYDCIYFTSSEEIVKYVNEKRIYEISPDKSGLEARLNKFYVEKETKKQDLILQIKNENIRFLEDQDRRLIFIKNELERVKKIHEENRKKIEKQENKAGKFYKEYLELQNILNKSLNEFENGQSIDFVKNKIFKTKDNFLNATRDFNNNIYLDSFSPREIVERKPLTETENYINYSQKTDPKKFKEIVFFGIVFVVLISIILMIFNMDFYENDIVDENNTEKSPPSNSSDNTTSDYLNYVEKTYGFLIENDRNITNYALKESKVVSLDSVVEIIFKKNPTDIYTKFKDKKEEYKKYLLDENPECFDDNQRLIRDLLKIPSQKK